MRQKLRAQTTLLAIGQAPLAVWKASGKIFRSIMGFAVFLIAWEVLASVGLINAVLSVRNQPRTTPSVNPTNAARAKPTSTRSMLALTCRKSVPLRKRSLAAQNSVLPASWRGPSI